MAHAETSQTPSRPTFREADTSQTVTVSPEPPQKDDGDWHRSHHVFFISHIFATIVMIFWPWIFFGIVWHRGGIQMHGRAAVVVYNNPSDTTFIATTIASILTFFIDYLFARAITSLAQKWVVHKDLDIFRISFFTALKSHEFLWHKEDWRELLRPGRRLLVPTALFFIVSFTFVTSGITALLTPATFTQNSALTGTELDFASTNPSCISWFSENTIPHDCVWTSYKGANYTTCLGENQMVDVLESGRGNILSLISNDSVSLTLAQLGGADGLRFLGQLRGVLPIGSKGLPAFDTVSPSPFSKRIVPANLPYNYTLNLQGLVTNITCTYDTASPVAFTVVSPGLLQYNGTCPAGQDVLTNATFISIISDNYLGFWACKTSPQGSSEESYALYLRGRGFYATSIGNITCSLSPVHPAVFPATYTSQPGFFSTGNTTLASGTTSTELISRSVLALGDIIWEAQNRQSNLVAESVITFGVKSFLLPPDRQDKTYLRLYEAMLKGIIEYQATYIRLLYSTQTAPSSCIRTVSGSADYEVFGWSVTRNTAAYLLPMTLINLTSFVVLVYAMLISDHGPRMLPLFDPLNPEALIKQSDRRNSYIDPAEPRDWKTKVVYAKDKDGKYAFQLKSHPDVSGNDNISEKVSGDPEKR